ncbi:MAG: YdcF family protein [Xanthobacteraceae bacterium]|nr:YdcF family protein [Xanthobacteraceae bacterium]
MFFVASKIFGFLTTPSNVIALVCVIGVLLLLTRWRACGRGVTALGVALLVIGGFSPLGNLLFLPLTERFPAWQQTQQAPTGIIVLGGAIYPDLSEARKMPELNGAAERMTAGVELAQRYPNAKFVFTGGNASLFDRRLSEATYAGKFFEGLGIPKDRIILEDRSRTTFENALFSKELLKPKPGDYWLVVTSAYHMPRAIGSFRAAGFDVHAYPVDWRTRGWRDAWTPFESISDGLHRLDMAVHEWIGLAGYRVAGRSSAFFPAP